jgi:D-alanyl-D-alanine carboxypeptidase
MISTTDDLTRFYQALMTGKLLPAAQLAEMKTTVPAPGLADIWPGVRYGLGLMQIPPSCGGSYFAHGGDLPPRAPNTAHDHPSSRRRSDTPDPHRLASQL